ncbi:MAG: hypothetical protein KGI59_00630 [Patescibacteria group bacterium]|nr:hypothetical protein [Patescibacteria group bacterium]
MNSFQLLATPWWVNLLILVPFAAYFFWHNQGLSLSKRTLLAVALFGIAFGFNEAVVVVYLRSALNISQQIQALTTLSSFFSAVEFWREAATIIMLASVAWLGARSLHNRAAVFLWAFAFWDIFYYVGLWATIHWPISLLSSDVLFLIPVPWLSQVWFPILVSLLTIGSVILARRD